MNTRPFARTWPGGHIVPPIVCLHALGGSSTHFVGVGPRLAHLGAVQAIDLGGHGGTSRSVGVTLERNRQLLARLLAATGPAVLIGSSFGAGVALMQAAADPASVRGLVLSGAMMPLVPDRRARQRTDLIVRRLRQRASDVVESGRAVRDGRLRRGAFREYMLRGNAASPQALDAEVLNAILAEPSPSPVGSLRTTFVAGLSSLRLMTDTNRFTRIVGAVAAPVLVIHGDRDRTVPVAQAVALVRARGDWQLEVLEGVGHLPHLESPDRWFEAIVKWWPEVERGGVGSGASDPPTRPPVGRRQSQGHRPLMRVDGVRPRRVAELFSLRVDL